MNKQRRAFTLIELLVVIAIIAILAAILFPVFAQAKAAAKYAVGISNVKQLELSNLMYSNDYDDMRIPEAVQDIEYDANGHFVAVTDEWSWKQVAVPYVKSQGIYADPYNPAAKWLDDHSDPGARFAHTPPWHTLNVPANLLFDRGYALANIANGQAYGFVNDGTISLTSISSVVNTFDIVETKDFWTNMGPYISWVQNGPDTDESFAGSPVTGLQWNWGAGKWNGQAMGVAYMDGHAKRISFGQMCGESYLHLQPNAGTTDNWNLEPGVFDNNDANWQNDYSWADSVCTSLPSQFN